MSADTSSLQPPSPRAPRLLRRMKAFHSTHGSQVNLLEIMPSLATASEPPMAMIRLPRRQTSVVDGVLIVQGFPAIFEGETKPSLLPLPESTDKGIKKPNIRSFVGRLKWSVMPRPRHSQGHPKISLPFDPVHNLDASSKELPGSVIHVPPASQKTLAPEKQGQLDRTVPEKGPRARSRTLSPALSSHIIKIPEIVLTTPDLHASPISAAPAYQPLRTACRHLGENSAWEYENAMERKRRRKLEERLERVLGSRAFLEDVVVKLREQIHSLQAETAAQHRRLDHEVSRGQFLDNEIFHLREEVQLLQTEASAQRSKAKTERVRANSLAVECDALRDELALQRPKQVAAANHKLELERYLDFIQEESTTHKVKVDYQRQKADETRALDEKLMNKYRVMQREFRNEIDSLQRTIQELRGMGVQQNLQSSQDCCSSTPQQSDMSPQPELVGPATGSSGTQSQRLVHVHIHELGATASNEALRLPPDEKAASKVTNQLPNIPHPKTPTLFRSLVEVDSQPPQVPNSSQPKQDGLEPKPLPPFIRTSPLQQFGPDLDTSPEADDAYMDRPTTNTLFRFGSRRIQVQAVPAVHRLRISIPESETEPESTSLIPHLSLWEWSSVPDLELQDPRYLD